VVDSVYSVENSKLLEEALPPTPLEEGIEGAELF